MDRIEQVARLIRARRTGPTVEEIVEATKRGLVTGEQANRLLERMADAEDWAAWEREVPCGAYLEEEAEGESLEDAAARAEVSNALLRVINDLPPRQRQCVELYYFEEMTQEQIAERLGVDRRTVRTHIDRAEDGMRESLGTVSPISPLDTRSTYEGNFWDSLMALTHSKQSVTHPCIYPYELWARYNAGARQADNGRWVAIVEDRLGEYIAAAFGRGVCKPWRY